MLSPCLTHIVLYILSFSLFSWNALGDLVNRTIDDTKGDSVSGQTVTYFPETPDGAPWATPNCPVCAIKPDLQQTFDGTYRAATWYPANDTMGISTKFSGTAVYVFFILVNNIGSDITTLTIANFTLDEGEPELFQHIPDPSNSDILYKQPVFIRENLENKEHSLIITASKVVEPVYVNFDYMIYTYDDDAIIPSPAPSSQTPTSSASTSLISGTTTHAPTQGPRRMATRALIVGSVAGGAAVAGTVAALIVALWLRRQRHKRQMETPIQFPRPTELAPEGSVVESEHQAAPSALGPSSSEKDEWDVRRSDQQRASSVETEYSDPIPSQLGDDTEGHSLPGAAIQTKRTTWASANARSQIDSANTYEITRQSVETPGHTKTTLRGSQVSVSASTEGLLRYTGPPPEYKA